MASAVMKALKALKGGAAAAAVGTFAGALVGHEAGEIHSKTESTVAGAKRGLLAGVLAAAAPKGAKGIGKFVFRRIRGRIVPIKVK